MPCLQGRYWLLTIRKESWDVPATIHEELGYVKGQVEIGAGGFVHWQILALSKKKMSLFRIKAIFSPDAHAELTRSSAANDYVWKDETAVEGTRFELGK